MQEQIDNNYSSSMESMEIVTATGMGESCPPLALPQQQQQKQQQQQQQQQRLVVVLAGSTGVGKSDVAARLCERRQGIIVSADSVQAYAGVEIGANKPTMEERRATPHLLIDIVDIGTSSSSSSSSSSQSPQEHQQQHHPYNAAEWRRDALYAIRKLLLVDDEEEETPAEDAAAIQKQLSPQKEAMLQSAILQARALKGYPPNQPLLPVVVGGTMMYLQWLVHGQPDALCPSPSALQQAGATLDAFEAADDWNGAVEHVVQLPRQYYLPQQEKLTINGESGGRSRRSDVGPAILQQQIDKLSGKDWYRLRRILEVAYTVLEQQTLQVPISENNNDNEEHDKNNLWERVYSGERQGGLLLDAESSSLFDVRCFFLCPNDRMNHTRIIDKRCEEMVIRGLLKETTDLSLRLSSSSLSTSSSTTTTTSSGIPSRNKQQLPDMISKAIGYRQALDYLGREGARDGDVEAFQEFLDLFSTATRRYARKQMLWFRKDPAFVFVPVDISKPKSERNDQVAREIERMISMPRDDFDNKERLASDSISVRTRRETELQAKKMKTYQFQRFVLKPGSQELATALQQADECTRLFQTQ